MSSAQRLHAPVDIRRNSPSTSPKHFPWAGNPERADLLLQLGLRNRSRGSVREPPPRDRHHESDGGDFIHRIAAMSGFKPK